MILKKLIVFLCVETVSVLTLSAQRDFQLVEDRNFWLTSGNGASLTTFSVNSISEGRIYFDYQSGALRKLIEGKNTHSFGADVKSIVRLSEKIVLAGNAVYCNKSATELSGSMLLDINGLKPFDLIEITPENAGDKRFESFNITGKFGWKIADQLAIGASADFTAGTYTKHRDLRHTNTLMNLNFNGGIYWSLGSLNGIGADIIYRRGTETIKFETFGTTDKVFTTLVDYANGYGITETFGGEGFTDSEHETPLFSQFYGASIQGGLNGFFGDFSFLHQTGDYGKKSQYTVSYANFSGNRFIWHIRYVMPGQPGRLCIFQLSQSTEVLTTNRTNYRKETLPENPDVTFYAYYDPTKVADKMAQTGKLSFTGYWNKNKEIYLWRAYAEISYRKSKQTAYIFPYILTQKYKSFTGEISAKRNILLKNRSMITSGLNCTMEFGDYKVLKASAGLRYEFSIKSNESLRPYIGLSYEFSHGIKDSKSSTGSSFLLPETYSVAGLSRNSVTLYLGIIF